VSYVVQLSPLVSTRLAALSAEVQDLFVQVLARLAEEPHHPEARCLDRTRHIYRRRIGDGVIVYRRFDHLHVVLVMRLRWRGP
jgi:mRNA-degrading endonuclease RelE of RelBE toxin-antitoxin system